MKQYATETMKDDKKAGRFIKIIIDASNSSNRLETIPAGLYNFVTLYNNTRFDFILYDGNIRNPLNIIGHSPPYTLITFPFDASTTNLFIEWTGTAGSVERCKIFVTHDNLNLGLPFRPPSISPAAVQPGRRIFGGVATATTIFTVTTLITVKSIYLVNVSAAAAIIRMSHRRAGVDIRLLFDLSIAVNSTLSLGPMVFEAGDSLIINSVTAGAVEMSIYGEGL